jgi:hypothetical protein
MSHEFITTKNTITHDTSTTQYSAKDIISAGTTVPMIINTNLDGGRIVKVLIKTNCATMIGAVRLWFYSGTTPTFAADNATMAMLYSESYIGYADVTLETWGTASSVGQVVCDVPFVKNTTNTIGSVLTSGSTPTPASGTIITVTVVTENYD